MGYYPVKPKSVQVGDTIYTVCLVLFVTATVCFEWGWAGFFSLIGIFVGLCLIGIVIERVKR
jgi:hypothetical protein